MTIKRIFFLCCLFTTFQSFSQSDRIEVTTGNNINWYESTKFKLWNEGLLIKVRKENNTFDTISLKDIITGKDQMTSFRDQNDEIVNFKTFEKKVVLLDFWFLNCRPCLIDLPMLNLLNNKINSEELEIVTFANDSMEEISSKILSKKKLNFRIIPNAYIIASSYPYKVLLSKDHELVDSQTAGSIDPNAITEMLNKYLPLIRKEIKK